MTSPRDTVSDLEAAADRMFATSQESFATKPNTFSDATVTDNDADWPVSTA